MAVLRRTRKSGKSLGLMLVLPPLALITGCSSESISGMGFQHGLSSVNDTSLSLWQGAWIAAAVVGVFTAGLILWPVFFHRHKKDGTFPRQTQYNVPAEVAYTVIPFIIVAVLFAFTARAESKVVAVSPKGSVAHNIHIEGIQWSWQFTYEDASPHATVTGTTEQPPTLYLPVGERVRFSLDSNDVVHGFWIPAFMIQMQNLPGVTNHLEFTAKKIGTFPGRCNILCGRNHSQMIFYVKVVSPEDYRNYIASVKES